MFISSQMTTNPTFNTAPFLTYVMLYQLFSMAACAAASLAIGTLKGEQLT